MARTSDVGIIGIGAMGSMIVNAHFAFGDTTAYRLTAASRNRQVLARLQGDHPLLAIAEPAEVVERCRMVFVCVPPLAYLEVVGALTSKFTADKTLVCITGGVPLDAVAGLVDAAVVKVIPSMTHRIGRGVALVGPGGPGDDERIREVEDFIRPFALPVRVPASDMRLAANLTGCGPAVFAHFLNLLVEISGGRAREVDRAGLYRMASETFCATARLIEEGMTPHAIAEEAATGGGTTEVALEALTPPLESAILAMIAATDARENDMRARSTPAPPAA